MTARVLSRQCQTRRRERSRGLTPAEPSDKTNKALIGGVVREGARRQVSEAREPSGLRIGPVAHDLLFENDDVKIWRVNTEPGQTFWNHYHNHDYVLFYTTDVLATSYWPKEDDQQLWNSRYGYDGGVAGRNQPGINTRASSVFFIPGTGFLSAGYINIGATSFVAPLIEVKRPRRPDQQTVGFMRSDALVGLPIPSGTVHLVENDRVRVFQTTLEPGESADMRPTLDAAIYVIEGSRIATDEVDDDGAQRTVEEDRLSTTGLWSTGGPRRRQRNAGPSRYRELRVELK
jgi:hypothetical protein